MAQRQYTTYQSDLSGAEIAEESPTVSFGLDGKSYAVDLTVAEQESLRDALAPYIEVARAEGRATPRKSAAGSSTPKSSAATVRAWASANGYKVPERGRLPAEVKEAWENAGRPGN